MNIESKHTKFDIILDSGAFTAWTKKIKIDLDAYIEFIKKHLDNITIAVALDVIPGSPNKPLTSEDKIQAAKQSWKNYKYMLKKGVPEHKVMPVFHQGEDEKWLEKMVNRCQYIGVSPANDKTPNQRIQWLNKICRKYIINDLGKPIIIFHGFGVTSIKVMEAIPWYSVDSASWKLHASRFGSIDIPMKLPNPITIKDHYINSMRISKRNTIMNEKINKKSNLNLFDAPTKERYEILTKNLIKSINEYIGKFPPYSFDKLLNNEIERQLWNAEQYYTIANRVFPNQLGYKIKLYFATGKDAQSVQKIQKRIKKRYNEKKLPILISYHYLSKTKIGSLEKGTLLWK